MLDNDTMKCLSAELLVAERVNRLLLDLGFDISTELPIRLIYNEIADIVIQDIYATFKDVANKCENEKDKILILLTNEQLYGKYGKL